MSFRAEQNCELASCFEKLRNLLFHWDLKERLLQLKITDIPKCVLLAVIRAYQWAISPLLPPACRYVPTCSEYALEAIDRYGYLRGSAIAIARVLRCHPFVRGGYDPVPLDAPAARTDRVARTTPDHSCTSH